MSIANEIQRLQTAKANIKSAIENKGVTVGDGTIDTYAEKIGEISRGDYNQGYEDGKNSVVNPFEYAVELTKAFYGATFPDGYELTLNLPNVTSLYRAFYNAKGIEKLVIKGNDNGNIISFERAFCTCRTIKTIDLTEFNAKISSTYMCFYYATALYEILGELDFSEYEGTSIVFESCNTLEELRIKKETLKTSLKIAQSQLLSTKTIQSIIDGLVDLTGGTAQTLTLHATVGAKLTDEQKATITAKNWTLVY